ncbi:MAG: hypothetical protein LBU22_11775 [Dysgonamonadaceae bacterium]|nr:hypothetical protein [Dysgonamonadaceae bacterium]
MVQITLKNGIDRSQMNVLLHLLSSWNVEAEISEEKSEEKKADKLFSRTRGMWKDDDIDAKELRRQAWKLDKSTQHGTFYT